MVEDIEGAPHVSTRPLTKVRRTRESERLRSTGTSRLLESQHAMVRCDGCSLDAQRPAKVGKRLPPWFGPVAR